MTANDCPSDDLLSRYAAADLPQAGDFEGRVQVVANDRRFVARGRPNERGTAEGSIAFLRTTAAPRVVVQVGDAAGTMARVGEDGTCHVARTRFPVRITRATGMLGG